MPKPIADHAPKPLVIQMLLESPKTQALGAAMMTADVQGNGNGLFEYTEVKHLSARDRGAYARLLGGVAPAASTEASDEGSAQLKRVAAEPKMPLGKGAAFALEWEHERHPSIEWGATYTLYKLKSGAEKLGKLSDAGILDLERLSDDDLLCPYDLGLLRFMARNVEIGSRHAKYYKERLQRFLRSDLNERDLFHAGRDMRTTVAVLKRLAAAVHIDPAELRVDLADGSGRKVGLKAFEGLDPETYAAPTARRQHSSVYDF